MYGVEHGPVDDLGGSDLIIVLRAWREQDGIRIRLLAGRNQREPTSTAYTDVESALALIREEVGWLT
jgi:hypothetical protein